MTQSIPRWLAILAMAAGITGSPIQTGAADGGPGKASITPTEKSVPEGPAGSTSRPKRDTYPFRGRVAGFDAETLTLRLEGKVTPRVVHLNPRTRLVRQGLPAKHDDLKAGEEVGGTLRKDEAGREEAVLIRIGPKPDPERRPNEGIGPDPGRSDGDEPAR
ncbi:MAG: hypothetical protein AB7O66_04975 [Limisphaerales bacterium]